MHPNLRSLMAPTSVAIVGASADPETIGGAPLRRLLDFGFSGSIHLVSRREAEISGVPCVASVSSLPLSVDVAVLAVPRAAIPGVLVELADRDVKAAIVFASGFAETGDVGVAEQARIGRIAADRGVALAGPNCLGLINFVEGVPLTFSALTPRAPTRSPGISIVSQSGAMAMALTYAAHSQGVDVAYTVSTGNEAVLSVEDYLPYLIADPMTKVIALLIEQFRDPQRFLVAARAARLAGKPIVAIKAGRSDEAREAALSHTGALAGDFDTIETVVSSEGVLLVDSMDELIDLAALLSGPSSLVQPGTALMSESGSVKTLAIDAASRYGATLTALEPATVARLGSLIPSFAAATNPVDITGQALMEPQLYGDVAQTLLDDTNVGVLIAATMPGTEAQTRDQVDALLPVLAKASKPAIYTFAGGDHPVPGDAEERVRAEGVIVFPSVDRALRAVSHAERQLRLRKWAVESAHSAAAKDGLLKNGTDVDTAWRVVHDESTSKDILRSVGLQVPRSVVVRDPGLAASEAEKLGFPVAAKAVSDLVHKTEANAVVVGIRNKTELAAALTDIAGGVSRAGHLVDGFLIEAMAGAGVDLILGARRDDSWGVVLLLGLGGVMAEAMKDTVLLPNSPSADQIREALSSLRGAALLSGYRGQAAADIESVVTAVQALGQLMRDNLRYVDVDINPLRVMPTGQGALVLDATIIEKGTAEPDGIRS